MAAHEVGSDTEHRAAHLDSLCRIVAEAAQLEESGRLDQAAARWARELATPGEVVLLVEQARSRLRAGRRRDEVLGRIALAAVTSVGERLVQEALTDPLTGLPSRGRMEDEVQHLLALSLRTGRPLTAVLLDVDGLKGINDEHGHGAGDAALAEVGRAVREHLRRTDRAYRWGGDEFLLLMTADLDGTSLVVERIRRSCATPLSYGAALHTGGAAPVDVVTWLGEADADLYRRRSSDRAVVPLQRRGGHLHPARQAALGGLVAAAAVTVGWAGMTAAGHLAPHAQQRAPRVAAAPPAGQVETPVATDPAPVVVAPARATRSRGTARPAAPVAAPPAVPAVAVPVPVLHVPTVQVPVVPLPVVVPPPADPGATSTSLVPRLVHTVRDLVGTLLPL